MGSLSFLLQYMDKRALSVDIFKYVQPMAVGFLAFGGIRAYQISIRNTATFIIMVVAMGAAFFSNLLGRSPRSSSWGDHFQLQR